MNNIIDHVTAIVWHLDRKKFTQIALSIMIGATAVLGIIIYTQHRRDKKFKLAMKNINTQREEVKKILEKNDIIKQYQERAEQVLAQDKNFLLATYIDNELIAPLQLTQKPRRISTNIPENLRDLGYQEVKADLEFTNLDMKQLVDLLEKLEKNNRIDIKKLDITKSKQQPKIDIALTISTIEHRTGTSVNLESE